MIPALSCWRRSEASSIRESTGPTRVVTGETNDVTRHPLGFAPPAHRGLDRDPLLWEGDQA